MEIFEIQSQKANSTQRGNSVRKRQKLYLLNSRKGSVLYCDQYEQEQWLQNEKPVSVFIGAPSVHNCEPVLVMWCWPHSLFFQNGSSTVFYVVLFISWSYWVSAHGGAQVSVVFPTVNHTVLEAQPEQLMWNVYVGSSAVLYRGNTSKSESRTSCHMSVLPMDLSRFSYLHWSLPYATWACQKITNKDTRY